MQPVGIVHQKHEIQEVYLPSRAQDQETALEEKGLKSQLLPPLFDPLPRRILAKPPPRVSGGAFGLSSETNLFALFRKY